MGKADLSRTTFSRDPKAGVEVADIYESNALEKFAKAPSAKPPTALSSLLPDISADKTLALINDPKTKSFLDKRGVELPTALNQIKSLTPSKVNFSKAIDAYGPEKLQTVLGTMQEAIPSDKLNQVSDGILGHVMEAWDTNAIFGEDLAEGFTNWQNSETLGFDNLEANYKPMLDAYKFGVVAWGVSQGDYSGLSVWLLEATEDSVGDSLTEQMLQIAATTGVVFAVKTIVEKLKERRRLKKELAQRTIPKLLRGYNFNRGKSNAEKQKDAKGLVDQLYELDPNWQIATRDGKEVFSYHNYHYASVGSLEIMQWDNRTSVQASIYKERNLHQVRSGDLVRKQYPFIL